MFPCSILSYGASWVVVGVSAGSWGAGRWKFYDRQMFGCDPVFVLSYTYCRIRYEWQYLWNTLYYILMRFVAVQSLLHHAMTVDVTQCCLSIPLHSACRRRSLPLLLSVLCRHYFPAYVYLCFAIFRYTGIETTSVSQSGVNATLFNTWYRRFWRQGKTGATWAKNHDIWPRLSAKATLDHEFPKSTPHAITIAKSSPIKDKENQIQPLALIL